MEQYERHNHKCAQAIYFWSVLHIGTPVSQTCRVSAVVHACALRAFVASGAKNLKSTVFASMVLSNRCKDKMISGWAA